MNTIDASVDGRLDRIRRYALYAGAAGLVLCLMCAAFLPLRVVLGAYLIGFLYVLGAGLGGLAILMIHHLTGGAWGRMIRRVLEASSRTLPMLALFAIPVLLGMGSLYLWTHAEVVAADEVLSSKTWYLNVPGFIVRTVGYFAVWLVLAFLLNRWAREEERVPSPHAAGRLRSLSGPGLVLYGLTMTFAAFDWAMSLEPHWFSTIYGVLFLIGQAANGFALAVGATLLLARWRGVPEAADRATRADLGSLMLAFIMLWAYIALSQFLIIWSGNLPEEIPWYLVRMRGGWGAIGLLLAIFHFAVPFVLLLQAGVKRNPRTLLGLAGLVLVVRALDLVWTVAPSFSAHGHQDGVRVALLAPLAILGLAGLWLAEFVRQLRSRSLLPYPEALPHGLEASAEVA